MLKDVALTPKTIILFPILSFSFHFWFKLNTLVMSPMDFQNQNLLTINLADGNFLSSFFV